MSTKRDPDARARLEQALHAALPAFTVPTGRDIGRAASAVVEAIRFVDDADEVRLTEVAARHGLPAQALIAAFDELLDAHLDGFLPAEPGEQTA